MARPYPVRCDKWRRVGSNGPPLRTLAESASERNRGKAEIHRVDPALGLGKKAVLG